jgi:Spy/CpxP family protein refolding chaperone
MQSIRAVALLSPLALSFILACGSENKNQAMTTPGVSPPTANVQPTPSGVMAQQPQQRMMVPGSDPAGALLWAADQMQLPEMQRTSIRGLEDQLVASRKQTMNAFEGIHADLAAQIRAGSMNPTKIQSDEGAAVSAVQSHMSKEADILNGLHGVLDGTQRRAAVAAVRARMSGRTEAQAGTAAQGGTSGGETMSDQDMANKKLEHLTRKLDLDANQQQQVGAIIAQEQRPEGMSTMMEERQRRMDAILAGFESDSFDARTLMPPASAIGDMVQMTTNRHVDFLTKIVPILRPEQREKLAMTIERGETPGQHEDSGNGGNKE